MNTTCREALEAAEKETAVADDYEAAIQAGAQPLVSFGYNRAKAMSKAVIDAAVAAGTLVTQNEVRETINEWAADLDACRTEVERLHDAIGQHREWAAEEVAEDVIDAAIASGELVSASELQKLVGYTKNRQREVERLRDAIRRHRDAYAHPYFSPRPNDHELWRVLEDDEEADA